MASRLQRGLFQVWTVVHVGSSFVPRHVIVYRGAAPRGPLDWSSQTVRPALLQFLRRKGNEAKLVRASPGAKRRFAFCCCQLTPSAPLILARDHGQDI